MKDTDLICPFSAKKCCGSECVFWSAECCVLLEVPVSSMELEDKLDKTNERLDEVVDTLNFIAKRLYE